MKTTALTLALGAPLSLALVACAPEAGDAEGTVEPMAAETGEAGEDGEMGEDGETDAPVDERTTEEGPDDGDRTGPEDRSASAPAAPDAEAPR